MNYYMEVQYDEHLLFAKEIAKKYGVNPNIVRSVIQKYEDQYSNDLPKLYYKTKYGLCRVYFEQVWKSAMEQYIDLKSQQN